MSYEQLNPLWQHNLFCGGTVQCVFRVIANVFFIISFVYFSVFLGNMVGWNESCEWMGLQDEVKLTWILIFGPTAYVLLFAVTSRSFSTMTEKPNRFWVLLAILQCPVVLQQALRSYGRYSSCSYYSYTATLLVLIPLFILNSLSCAAALFMTCRLQLKTELYELDFSLVEEEKSSLTSYQSSNQ